MHVSQCSVVQRHFVKFSISVVKILAFSLATQVIRELPCFSPQEEIWCGVKCHDVQTFSPHSRCFATGNLWHFLLGSVLLHSGVFWEFKRFKVNQCGWRKSKLVKTTGHVFKCYRFRFPIHVFLFLVRFLIHVVFLQVDRQNDQKTVALTRTLFCVFDWIKTLTIQIPSAWTEPEAPKGRIFSPLVTICIVGNCSGVFCPIS